MKDSAAILQNLIAENRCLIWFKLAASIGRIDDSPPKLWLLFPAGHVDVGAE
jgi:hypothetical protein